MNKCRLSTLGFVLDRLNIQTVALSRALHVDSSLVSKWKSGSRCLNSKSVYYEEIIRFLLQESKKSNHLVLKKTLSEVYPLEPVDAAESPEPYLRQLLCNCKLTLPNHDTIGVNEAQQAVQIRLLDGNNGKRQAVRKLLSIAEQLKAPGQIVFIDSEEYGWLLHDMDFAKEFVQRMNKLLGNGFQARFVIHFSSYRERFVRFFEICNLLLFHRNAKWYYYEYYDENAFNLSFFILEKAISMLGISASQSSPSTMLFTDTESVIHHGAMADSLINRCQRLFMEFAPEKCRDVVEYVAAIQKRGALYAYLPAPAFVAVKTDLLREILTDNNMESSLIEHCLRVNRMMRDLTHAQFRGLDSQSGRIIQILQLEEMIRRAKNTPFISCSLTLLGGSHIRVSPKQYALCIRQLADGLARHDNIELAFLSEKDRVPLPSIPEMNCWCKQNTWMVQMDQQGFRITDEVSIVNAASITLERCLRKIPPERKEKDAVISYLLHFAEEMDGKK